MSQYTAKDERRMSYSCTVARSLSSGIFGLSLNECAPVHERVLHVLGVKPTRSCSIPISWYQDV